MGVGCWRYLSRIMACVDLTLVLGLTVLTILVGIAANTCSEDLLAHNLEQLDKFIQLNNFSDRTVAVLRLQFAIDSLSNSDDCFTWLIMATAILFITTLLLFCQSISLLVTISKAERQDALESTSKWQTCNAIMLIFSSVFCVVFVAQDTSAINWCLVVATLVFVFTRALFFFVVSNFMKELKQYIPSSSPPTGLDVVTVEKE